jgi:hypothetical protein
MGWDVAAPCRRFTVRPLTTGFLDVELQWSAFATSHMDLLVAGAYGPEGNPLRVRLPVTAGVVYEIRVHSYYGTHDFSLTTTLHSLDPGFS